ncbi:MAG: hypothetical protein RL708_1753 [Bacteroidota bacterium]|jgi:uncharacterized Fe-S cluster protein YjdI
MNKNNLTKEYGNDKIIVVWQSGKCIHSGNCVHHLPTVFHPKESPWIQVEQATTDEIRATVAKCPSGALSIKEKQG